MLYSMQQVESTYCKVNIELIVGDGTRAVFCFRDNVTCKIFVALVNDICLLYQATFESDIQASILAPNKVIRDFTTGYKLFCCMTGELLFPDWPILLL